MNEFPINKNRQPTVRKIRFKFITINNYCVIRIIRLSVIIAVLRIQFKNETKLVQN